MSGGRRCSAPATASASSRSTTRVVGNLFVFASEAKALLPFLPEIDTDPAALAEYLTFQYTLGETTLFRGVKQLMPGHASGRRKRQGAGLALLGCALRNRFRPQRHAISSGACAELLDDTIDVHLRSDVPVGAYVSGGIDSSLIAILAGKTERGIADCFHGRFTRISRL